MQRKLVAITCANGRQAAYLIPHLENEYELRLIVQSENSYNELRARYPTAEVLQGDLLTPKDCAKFVRGANIIYHVGPSLHPHETQCGYNMIDAAVSEAKGNEGFEHFVYSSVLNTQFRRMFNHDRKRYVEEYLFESGLNYTVLNPGDFLDMQFPIKIMQGSIEGDVWKWTTIFEPETTSAPIVLGDFGEAAAKVIVEGERHYQAQYQLCSMKPIPYGNIAKDVAAAFGKRLQHVKLPYEERVNLLCFLIWGTHDVDARLRDGAEKLILFYSRRGLQGNPNTLEWLLGRKPTDHRQYIAKALEA